MTGTIGMIAALSPDRVIGRDGDIPWHYPADLKRFKRVTLGSTIIMGRRTWESIGCRALPRRRNLVISRTPRDEVETFASLEAALATCEGEVWLVGGAAIYAAGLAVADVIDITWVPDHVPIEGSIRFPEIDEAIFDAGARTPHPENPRLELQRYSRRDGA